MRNKLKKMMKKEEGFTLVELLAVIVILGIIVAIAIPAVGSVIDRAGDDADEAESALVEDAARLYFTTENPDDNEVTVTQLITNGYLEERGEDDELSGTVTRTADTGTGEDDATTYTYEFDRGAEGD